MNHRNECVRQISSVWILDAEKEVIFAFGHDLLAFFVVDVICRSKLCTRVSVSTLVERDLYDQCVTFIGCDDLTMPK